MSGDARLSEADRRSAGPLRTCVGCRERAERSRLLRVVAARESGTETPGSRPPAPVALIPDLRSTLPGRGAWVHPDLACLELAARRRAFVRALRVQGPVDDAAVRAHVAGHQHGQQSPTVEIGSGSASDGYPMSSQR